MSARSITPLQQRANTDLRRWLSEVDAADSRGTLRAGMLKKAFSYAEELLKESAAVFLDALPDGGAEALAIVSNKKTNSVSKLTIGQYVQLLMYLESNRQLGSTRRVISKTDEQLMYRITAARNGFAHGSASALTDTPAVKQYLADLIALSNSDVIRLAASRGD